MKRIQSLLVVVAGMVLGMTAQARTFEEIKASGKIVVATEGAYPPFNYFQGSRLTGFEVELAEAMARKMGVAIEWKALAFNALLAGLGEDRWDLVVASFGITEERAKAATFTNPHYCSGGIIVSRDGSLRTPAMLAGKTVAVHNGTTYMENVKKVPNVKEVKTFPLDTDARSALVNGRVDAWISDRFVVKKAMEGNPNAPLKAGGYLFVEKVAPAVKKGNTSLAAAVDKALAGVMADGTYKALSEKYMKEDIRCPTGH